ncbi:E3 ubiquitin-protein ligase PPP1R11-like [Corticium candelabrum]|uniref:E3 ubiquitin-protein ligase PPP1R11-like n=1 Tax=Corticium candelabrum TaxID=121492 RepID=UPI002E27333F|nr:E3 ubiquitin-protein ligase PPP1R11-like [Corticium candelabrum]
MTSVSEEPSSSGSVTVVEEPSQSQTLVLKLKKPKSQKKVEWDSNAVDNEHMGKKKSKCCCIYHKQRGFGESDSESDTSDKELDHCHGNAYEPSDK